MKRKYFIAVNWTKKRAIANLKDYGETVQGVENMIMDLPVINDTVDLRTIETFLADNLKTDNVKIINIVDLGESEEIKEYKETKDEQYN